MAPSKTPTATKSVKKEKKGDKKAKRGNVEMSINLEEEIANDELYKKYFVPGSILSSVQVLRSASEWSAGIKKTENSILQAYYDLIYNAKQYIYIENQFFISKAWTDEEMKKFPYLIRDIVKNEIALLIRKRIERAYIKKENFKVFIFLFRFFVSFFFFIFSFLLFLVFVIRIL